MNSRYHSANFVVLLPSPAAVVPLTLRDEYPSKRRGLANGSDSFWLEEVHSKVWHNSAP